MDNRESLIRHLMETVRCSVCSASYQHDDVNILGHQDELWFLTVTCPDCRTQGLIAALVRGEGSDRGMHEAQPAQEPVRPSYAPRGAPLSEADVADMHDFLAGYQGDLLSLLQSR